MGDIRRCDQCAKPYRTVWRDPGICSGCAVENFRSALLEAIEPVVLPAVQWLNDLLEKHVAAEPSPEDEGG